MTGSPRALEYLSHSRNPTRPNTPRQNEIQQIVATITSTISVVLALVTLYLLFKIQRNFRHTLVKLLIVSQLFKTVWIWVYSISMLAKGRGRSGDVALLPNPAFCKGDGFLYAWGTEAADFVILLIAIHTAMTIFKHQTIPDQSGLFPYRYIAYAGWLMYPTLMASLAFINDKNSYVPQGSLCFLPIRPFWYRLALSWIPRYLILLFILSVYTAVYIYVRFKFRDLSQRMNHDSYASDILTPVPRTSTSTTLAPTSIPSMHSDPNASLYIRHRTIKKQLRFMFVYPVVYLLMWIIPFANHSYGYTQLRPPFAVPTVSLACLTLQCAADCAVFLLREKPWRHTETAQNASWSFPTFFRKMSAGSEKNAPPVLAVDIRHSQSPTGRNWWDAEGLGTPSGDGSAETRVAIFMSARYPV